MINTMIRITTRVPTPMYIEYPLLSLGKTGWHFVLARWPNSTKLTDIRSLPPLCTASTSTRQGRMALGTVRGDRLAGPPVPDEATVLCLVTVATAGTVRFPQTGGK